MMQQLQKKILIMALYAGEIMMKSGAEIYRVEDTVTRICKGFGIPYVEVFATTSGIFASLDQGSDDCDMHTFIKRIHGTGIDFEKISRVNELSRSLPESGMTVDEAMQELKEINKTGQFAFLWRVLGAAMVDSFFTIMLGGDYLDFAACFLIGAISYFASILFERLQLNTFVQIYCCCALMTFLSICFVNGGFGHNLNLIIIGSIMMFLPGVAFTNAIRDSLSGDILSGITRAAEAILVAAAIAAGVGTVLKIFGSLGGIF